MQVITKDFNAFKIQFNEEELALVNKFAAEMGLVTELFIEWALQAGIKLHQLSQDKKG